ncbi:membrane dipeptidase [Aureitalea marina]|nr:membrane dipeptidase [Aureitalea marina]
MGRYVDIHCHPAMKGFGKSFKYVPTGQNPLDPSKRNSIWRQKKPNVGQKLVNRLVTLTKFTQTDMTTLAKADVDLVVISLYPFEKHFLSRRILGWKGLTDLLVNLAAGISQKRIDHVLRHRDYFQDLLDELNYYKQLDNQVVKIDGIFYTYRLVSSFAEIETNRGLSVGNKRIINLVTSIEGAHVLNTGLEMDQDTADPDEVMENLAAIKSWEHRPLFMTFAHHFYNELCGHAPSISLSLIKENQIRGLDADFTPLGLKVLKEMLNEQSGARILIDVKHMSIASRQTYYQLLDQEYPNEDIPIVASHGAVNGWRSLTDQRSDYPNRTQWFNPVSINFSDREVVRIARSNGLLGIQLDERRIGNKKAVKASKRFWPNKRKQLNRKALLVWRQIEHMAEVLDHNDLFAWGIQCIGSDFDGIVDPINGLWTATNIKDLEEELLNHANDYLAR